MILDASSSSRILTGSSLQRGGGVWVASTPQVCGGRVYNTPQRRPTHARLVTHPYVIEKDETLEHGASVWQCVRIFPSGRGGGDY